MPQYVDLNLKVPDKESYEEINEFIQFVLANKHTIMAIVGTWNQPTFANAVSKLIEVESEKQEQELPNRVNLTHEQLLREGNGKYTTCSPEAPEEQKQLITRTEFMRRNSARLIWKNQTVGEFPGTDIILSDELHKLLSKRAYGDNIFIDVNMFEVMLNSKKY